MALTDEGNGGIPATMLVGPANIGGMGYPYPVYQSGGNGGNGGFGDGNGWWVILLILLLAGGWNNGGNGGGFIGGNNNDLYPWMNQANLTSNGFQNQMLNDNVTSIRDGIANLSTQLCNCCGDMQMAVANGFANAEQGANTRAMANMQQLFGLQSQFADCCCENRLASCQTQNIIARESAETRFADANNTRDLLTNQTQNTQAILDKLCQLELDNKRDRIADLERQLTMANFSASQIAQTAEIQRGQVAEVDALYQRLRDCPVGTMPVYGNQPIFTCPQQSNSCGCGCGNNF